VLHNDNTTLVLVYCNTQCRHIATISRLRPVNFVWKRRVNLIVSAVHSLMWRQLRMVVLPCPVFSWFWSACPCLCWSSLCSQPPYWPIIQPPSRHWCTFCRAVGYAGVSPSGRQYTGRVTRLMYTVGLKESYKHWETDATRLLSLAWMWRTAPSSFISAIRQTSTI